MKTIDVESHRLTDDQILDIIHSHGRWQNIKGAMNDAEFIAAFRKIVPYNSVCDTYGFVTTAQIAEIYNLRLTYECTPRSEKGFLPRYTDKSVRLQNGAKRLPWVPPDIMREILGYETKRMSYAWLETVLRMKLLRWGHEKERKNKVR